VTAITHSIASLFENLQHALAKAIARREATSSANTVTGSK
jgi:hypothetical protein